MSVFHGAQRPKVVGEGPVVVGELPYYRLRPTLWQAALEKFKSSGIDTVSFYVPWRFHEIVTGNKRSFDFLGVSDPQKDVLQFIKLIATCDLKAIVKPGPFIHAEVQLGGLPDRLCDSDYVAAYTGINGKHLRSQGRSLPRISSSVFQRESAVWLDAVNRQLVSPFASPNGPIVEIQLGNEGIVGEACRPLSFADIGDDTALDDLSKAEAAARQITSQWKAIAGHFPETVSKFVNVPLVRLGQQSEPGAFGSWLSRTREFQKTPFHVRHTEWVGDISSNRDSFLTHVLQIQAARSDVAEANWGFTWDTQRFANGSAPLFHALLSLILGSKTISVYTACATSDWNKQIDMDSAGLVSDGLSPELFEPPYCPGAPIQLSGERNANTEALAQLIKFKTAYGEELLRATSGTEYRIAIDPAVAARAANCGPESEELDELFRQYGSWIFNDRCSVIITPDRDLAGVRWVWRSKQDTEAIAEHIRQCEPTILRSTSGRIAHFIRSLGGVTFLGLFNPFEEGDIAEIVVSGDLFSIPVPANGALIARIEDHAARVIISTEVGE